MINKGRHPWLLLILAFFTAIALTSNTEAVNWNIYSVPQIDSLQDPTFVYDGASWGETITGEDTEINTFSLYLYKGSESVAGLTATLWNGLDKSEKLREFQVDPGVLPTGYGWFTVEVQKLSLNPGSTYFFELTSNAANANDSEAMRWPHLVTGDYYPTGEVYLNSIPYTSFGGDPGADKVMEIGYSSAPEPSSLLMLGAGALGIVGLVRKTRKT